MKTIALLLLGLTLAFAQPIEETQEFELEVESTSLVPIEDECDDFLFGCDDDDDFDYDFNLDMDKSISQQITSAENTFDKIKLKWGKLVLKVRAKASEVFNQSLESWNKMKKQLDTVFEHGLKVIEEIKALYEEVKKMGENIKEFKEIFKTVKELMQDLREFGQESYGDLKALVSETKLALQEAKSKYQLIPIVG
ncbi:hypothetical protein TKK_0001057 [Trichogramma kaykai]|uniref:Uncharacterized protein n=1 Tax=Trichogramma kaykai TaxID=54128 RepID=A0ABD2WT66_9HYME